MLFPFRMALLSQDILLNRYLVASFHGPESSTWCTYLPCHISVPVLIRLPVSLDFEITIISQLVGASTSSYGNYCTVFIWLVTIKFVFMSYPKLFNLSASFLQTSPQQELLFKVTFLLSTG